jgi:hypothetical protein
MRQGSQRTGPASIAGARCVGVMVRMYQGCGGPVFGSIRFGTVAFAKVGSDKVLYG